MVWILYRHKKGQPEVREYLCCGHERWRSGFPQAAEWLHIFYNENDMQEAANEWSRTLGKDWAIPALKL